MNMVFGDLEFGNNLTIYINRDRGFQEVFPGLSK
jgi:hypothetical protein